MGRVYQPVSNHRGIVFITPVYRPETNRPERPVGVALGQSSDACESAGGANASAVASSSDTEHPPIVAACSRVSVRARYSVNAVATDLDVIGYIT
jgi:hypothetical protein